MKDKLTKTHIKKGDYIVRKMGIFGTSIFVLSCAIILPLKNNLNSNNVALLDEIEVLKDERNESYTIFHKDKAEELKFKETIKRGVVNVELER